MHCAASLNSRAIVYNCMEKEKEQSQTCILEGDNAVPIPHYHITIIHSILCICDLQTKYWLLNFGLLFIGYIMDTSYLPICDLSLLFWISVASKTN